VLKFAPSLKLAVISGQPAERKEQLKASGLADLLVTSYALIKRDIKFYEKRRFKYCFLDEAQHVKNPHTLSAKSVKKIKANSYFALTGTPIENSLTELWSIFDFVMPGYLRTHKAFTSRYELPIVKNSDSHALAELTRHIHPFILRRMKKAVLKELPDKIESKMTNEMTKEQTKLYGAWILQAQAEFESEIAANGFEKSQIKILSLLTRLRQLCCHPALFIEDYHGGSGKLDMLKEILIDALASDHRILLFSQFTGMLNIIQQELKGMQIPYHYLDGATKAEERIKLVHSFNSGEKQMFLISLKAGGTGLNLTGADMVIHYDPWWNPAVEEQATDRAYRIGQKKAVQVYKLITKNTIEEKIYALQQKKREMIDSLIHPGETFLTKMNEAEIRELFTF
jgi:SNF2 family DNA or RNA helicase